MLDTTYYLRSFQSPSDRARATCELALCGQEAVPLLRSILDGSAKNEFGVAYGKLGMPIDCALVAITRLGPVAKPLEPLVRQQLSAGHPYAQDALSALGVA